MHSLDIRVVLFTTHTQKLDTNRLNDECPMNTCRGSLYRHVYKAIDDRLIYTDDQHMGLK